MTKNEIKFKIFLLDLLEIYTETKTVLWGCVFPVIAGYLFNSISVSLSVVAFAVFMYTWNEQKTNAKEVLKYAVLTILFITALFLGATILAVI